MLREVSKEFRAFAGKTTFRLRKGADTLSNVT